MTTAGSLDAPIEIFGGLVTDMSPADLPHGVSPDCQDVVFSNGGVATRPGLQALFGPLAGNPTINYVKPYKTLTATRRTMALDSNGVLYKETTPETLASVATGLAANAYANSTTLFGREYLAISDGKTGNDLPRQFDDTNLDRVSQSGPGAGPTVVDENVIVAVSASPNGATQPAAVTIAASPNGATENGFLVTITTTAAHGLAALPFPRRNGRARGIRRRYGRGGWKRFARRASSLCHFSNAPGLSHPAQPGNELDRQRRQARRGHQHSHRPVQYRWQDSLLHWRGRRQLFLHSGWHNALQRQHGHRRQHHHLPRRGFFRRHSARRHQRRQSLQTDRARRLRRRPRLRAASLLVGRAQQNEQLAESRLRRRVHRPFAAALSARLDARRRGRAGRHR